ncbi:MAG: multidrug ABC transporter substrate-binding protein [Bdellovibrio sp. 28-41-41]|nr:MAG: multidrug ABC transporter substrate-binding protein [Bdellovibrio sp. 28-41-41]
MKVKFNKFERVAGLFVLFAIAGCFLMAISVAIKQGWFENKIKFESIFASADGVHPGTTVLIAGLRAGSVEDVELLGNNKIRVTYFVLGKFHERIREDSKAQLVRPFVIGDRVLEISVGSPELKIAQEGVLLDSEETLDLMTLLSGKRLGTSLEKISEMLSNLQFLMEAFLDRDRTKSMLSIFDKLDPLMGNMNEMSEEVIKLSRQMTYKENLKKTISQTAILTKELNVILPELNRQNPQLAKNLAQLTGSLAQMTEDFKSVTVMMKNYGPEIPTVAKRALEALDEATVLMKAMQKNFFLRNAVQEVNKEESDEIKNGTRQPAREKQGGKP